ncbi:solute carrier family 12 member 2-like [Anneissia japonica]|uniref:solute carrier family 12 member 2-like n=1 Tax=Anneissia japonica TaxID=1529436 RepID=UPI0014257E78|nr:solute carrier family 12 member 2-like [Anneissia japonica]
MEESSETSNHASLVPASGTALDEKGEPAVPMPKQSRFNVKIVHEQPTETLPRNKGRMSMVDKNDTLNESMHVTFGQNTHEAIPSIAYYRNVFSTTAEAKRRPTLAELHEPKRKDVENSSPEDQEVGNVVQFQGSKFGWIKGVLVRCLLNIWGVMLFLRLTWITGQAGVGCATIIILMSTVVTVLTTLSMSAICTNGQVKGGGAYYMISRSLGPEFGGSIGLIFSLANAVAVAMYVVGFSETTRDLLHDNNLILVDEINDVRIIGVTTLVVCLGITMIGMAWEARAQLILLVILICSIIVLLIGSAIPPTHDEIAKGFVGFNAGTFKENFKPAYTVGESFFSIFSIFFPAATGILAGANISGDLRDAQKAIPKGTLLAIGITSVVYIGLVWLLGAVMVREASGNIADYFPVADAVTSGIVLATSMPIPTSGPIATTSSTAVICGAGKACEYGLLNDLQAAYIISAFAPFIIAGIFAATLSSALASLVSAPKVFQAVCKDNVFPKTKFFAKGVGPTDEPKRAYVLTFFIALAFIALGELNAIAPIISNFFLASYALINFSCFSASLSKTPGWRPAFKYYNKWVALLASVICIAVMFLINWYAACFTVAVVGALYLYVNHKKPEINWGSSTQALTYKQALQCTVKLLTIPEHTKTFRPQCLILSGAPECRPALVHFVSHITKNNSLLICGNVVIGNQEENRDQMTSIMNDHTNWLLRQKIKGFYSPIISKSLRSGAQSLLQISGLGKLRPNTMFLGFKSNWRKDISSNVVDYVGIIHDAFDLNYGVAILRFPQGLDVSAALNMQAQQNGRSNLPKPSEQTINEAEPLILEDSGETVASEASSEKELKVAGRPLEDSTALIKGHRPGSVIKSVNAFQDKQAKGTIDVWWLFDDGGLTLLIPHILTLRRQWERCKLRVFAGGKKDQIEKEKISMANMLSKFRIDCHSVEIIPDIGKKPQDVSLATFESFVEPFMLTADQDVKDFPGYITKEERKNLKEKTYRHIRLRELLFKHSKDANLIFLTLPMPRKEACSAYMYMAWLETLCNAKDLPPIVLMRGNQTSVLTYYS